MIVYKDQFIKTMIDLGVEHSELSIVDDEVGIPTSSSELAKSLKYLIENEKKFKPGIYHAVCEGHCSRYDEAAKIFEVLNMNIKLNRIKLEDFSRPARVPNYSILLNTKLPKLPKWDDALTAFLREKYIT